MSQEIRFKDIRALNLFIRSVQKDKQKCDKKKLLHKVDKYNIHEINRENVLTMIEKALLKNRDTVIFEVDRKGEDKDLLKVSLKKVGGILPEFYVFIDYIYNIVVIQLFNER